jgi:hypothetical protein
MTNDQRPLKNSVIPTGAGANATAEWRDLVFSSVDKACVGRTLLSAAFDVGLDFAFDFVPAERGRLTRQPPSSRPLHPLSFRQGAER